MIRRLQYQMKQTKQLANPKAAEKPSKKDEKQAGGPGAPQPKGDPDSSNKQLPPEASAQDVMKSQLEKKVVISANLKVLTANNLEKSLFSLAIDLTQAHEQGVLPNLVSTFKAASTKDSDLEAAHRSCLQVEDELQEALSKGLLRIANEAAPLPSLIHQEHTE